MSVCACMGGPNCCRLKNKPQETLPVFYESQFRQVSLSDKQWDHFIETMENPAPPTPLMVEAHRQLQELIALRAQHGGGSGG